MRWIKGLTVFVVGAMAGQGVAALAEVKPAATVVKVGEAPTRVSPSGKARIRILAQQKSAFLGQLELDAGGGVPEHQDPGDEYIFVLRGGGEITIDGKKHTIGPGSAVFMPADATVSYKNGDAPLVAIQVYAGPGPASKYDKWAPAAKAGK